MKIGVVMDPIGSINIAKDTSFALMLEAQARGWEIHYLELGDLFLRDGAAYGRTRRLGVRDDPRGWFEFGAEQTIPLAGLDAILMRKAPPFDTEYVYTTYLLERAEAAGVLVVNRPRSLRDANEKLFTAWFPQCTPPTLVTRAASRFRDFLAEHGDIVLKPLGAMGGESVFRLRRDDPNANVVIETMTDKGRRFALAQRFVPEIAQGDKRIFMIAGEPAPYALARFPAPGETRANLAAGGTAAGAELSARDRWICAQVGPVLREKGLLFVGLDVIGDYLTEINVTSPTGVRDLDRIYHLDLSAAVLDAVAARLTPRG